MFARKKGGRLFRRPPLLSFSDAGDLGPGSLTLSGDITRSRQAYDRFFALWKDADADLPILIDAKNEYKRLGS
jgi:hypothetical protein